MGLCDSNTENLGNYYNQVKIDGEIKDVSSDYLLKESIKIPIKSKYKFLEAKIGEGGKELSEKYF